MQAIWCNLLLQITRWFPWPTAEFLKEAECMGRWLWHCDLDIRCPRDLRLSPEFSLKIHFSRVRHFLLLKMQIISCRTYDLAKYILKFQNILWNTWNYIHFSAWVPLPLSLQQQKIEFCQIKITQSLLVLNSVFWEALCSHRILHLLILPFSLEESGFVEACLSKWQPPTRSWVLTSISCPSAADACCSAMSFTIYSGLSA